MPTISDKNYMDLEDEPMIRKLVIIMENYGIRKLKLPNVEIELKERR